jgi:hypothetical protein
MPQDECDKCKLLALMTELLKDNNETIKKLRIDNEKYLKSQQIKIDFNMN